MLHMFELAITSWLAFYATRTFGGDVMFYFFTWAMLFLTLYMVNVITSD